MKSASYNKKRVTVFVILQMREGRGGIRMIFITKRIRARLALKTIKEKRLNEPILDVGSGDNYFMEKAKSEGHDIQGVDLNSGKDFFDLTETTARSVIGLALLWHIDINRFFSHCSKLGIEKIVLIQSFSELEPLTKIYTPDHVHVTMKVPDIRKTAMYNNYLMVSNTTFLCWDVLYFEPVVKI